MSASNARRLQPSRETWPGRNSANSEEIGSKHRSLEGGFRICFVHRTHEKECRPCLRGFRYFNRSPRLRLVGYRSRKKKIKIPW
jgi:hypothetical protein